MATPTVSENPEVQQNYLAGLALGAAVQQAVAALWEALNPMASAEALARFTAGLLIVDEQFGGVSASLGADYYRNIRREAGITTILRLPEPVLPTLAEVQADIDWAMRERDANLTALKAGLPEITAGVDDLYASILADIQAESEKAVLDVQRTFLVEAVAGDEEALGFRRVPRPEACYWCIALAIRTTSRTTELSGDREQFVYGGEQHYGVYKTRKSAGQMPAGAKSLNRFHTNCHCTVEPVFAPADTIPDWLSDLETLYYDSTVDSDKGEHLNDFRKALRAHRNGEESPPAQAPVALPTSSPATAQIVAILDRLDAAMAA